MRTEKELLGIVKEAMLRYIEELPILGDGVDQEVWTKKVSKLFQALGGQEIVNRKEVYSALKHCINCRAMTTANEYQSGVPLAETTSPYALAYAMKDLFLGRTLPFPNDEAEEAFYRHYYRPKFLNELFDQLFFQEEISNFNFM